MSVAPEQVLRRVFGFPSFRGLQEQAVRHVVDGGDALVLMPTGGGKSLCYQIPALCRPGVAIVVSPLIALMDDQVAALRQFGIAAGALHSDQEPAAQRAVAAALDGGALDLVYVSPERLLANGTLDRLARLDIALVAVDEAHCVSQWGHEFRPEYRALHCLRQRFPGVPLVALTATADDRTRADILQALRIPQARVFTASFHRANLHIAAAPKDSETAQVQAFLRRHADEAGIVYCGTRARTERLAASLAGMGVAAAAFHAGLPAPDKAAVLARFRAGEPLVVCATIAFGMGIDRPDVRFVVHLDMPDSPEAYYQQIGRAGRDGERAETLLLYGGEDVARARRFLAESAAPEAQKHVMRARLEAMIALTETPSCRTASLLRCFGETLDDPCGHCDVCAAPVALEDGTVAAQKVLSAVARTGDRFGTKHVVDVLLGRQTDMVARCGHAGLSVFGIGRDHDEAFWRGVIRQLIVAGALRIEDGQYPTLARVPEQARPILRGETRFMLRRPAAAARPDRDRVRERTRSAQPVATTEAGSAAFDGLRAWRATEAKAQGVPAFVIFHDSVLQEIAQARPHDLAQLARIRGVGASKLDRYGGAVLAVLAATQHLPVGNASPAT